MKQYIVSLQGERVKDSNTVFESNKDAIRHMKDWFDFAKNMEVDLFSLFCEEAESKKDFDLGNTDKTFIQTEYSIV